MADAELVEYVVVADMVVIETGEVGPAPEHTPIVMRLERETVVNAPESNRAVKELLAMGGLVRKDTLIEDMRTLKDRGSKYRPTLVRLENESFRITAAGAALTLAGSDELPSAAVEDVMPLAAPDLDVSLPGA